MPATCLFGLWLFSFGFWSLGWSFFSNNFYCLCSRSFFSNNFYCLCSRSLFGCYLSWSLGWSTGEATYRRPKRRAKLKSSARDVNESLISCAADASCCTASTRSKRRTTLAINECAAP